MGRARTLWFFCGGLVSLAAVDFADGKAAPGFRALVWAVVLASLAWVSEPKNDQKAGG